MKTRAQLLEEVKAIMPQNYDDMQKAAFLANFVAQQVSFDEHFWWGNSKERKEAYENAKRQAITSKSTSKVPRKLICITITSLYVYLAKNMGLDVQYIANFGGEENVWSENNKIISQLKAFEHIAPSIKIKDRGYIKVDVQRDLHNLQTHCKPRFFGSKTMDETGIIELTDEEIDKVFRSINYIDKEYTDTYIDDILEKNKELPLSKKFKAIFTDERFLKEIQNSKCVEAWNFYKNITQKALKDRIKEQYGTNVSFFITYIKNSKSKKREYSFGIYSIQKDDEWIYMFSKRRNKLIEITLEEMKYLLEKGIEIKDMPGKNIFLNYLKRNNIVDTKKDKLSDFIEDIMYDDEQEIDL